MTIIPVTSRSRSELIDITDLVERVVREAEVETGIVALQALHTTAALTINENADPDVPRDVTQKMNELVPQDEAYYQHMEGNSDSHVKTSLFGPSLIIIVDEGRLVLGRWQGVYFCEWDGPRERRVAVQVIRGD